MMGHLFSRVLYALTALMLGIPAAAHADDATDRMIVAIQALGHKVPEPSVLGPACDGDALCVAKFIQGQIGAGAILVPSVDAESADLSPKTRAWRRSLPALTAVETMDDGTLYFRFTRFDVGALVDAIDAIAPPPTKVMLDLRDVSPGESLDSMRRLAAAFIGAQGRAFQVTYPSGRSVDWVVLKPRRTVSALSISIILTADADGTATVFAALLRKYKGAQILGAGPVGTQYARARVPVTHGWSLLVPQSTLGMPGIDLTNGLVPDGPIPESAKR